MPLLLHLQQHHRAVGGGGLVAARPPRACRPVPLLLAAPPSASVKGFGGGSGSGAKKPTTPPNNNKKTSPPSSSSRVQAADPEVQRAATLLLTALVAETDPQKRAQIARDNVETIDGVFFAVADAYAQMARSDNAGERGGEDVAAALEQAVKVALDAKQATLRPEIRLLNHMLDAPSLEARRAVLEADGGEGARLLRERGAREYLLQLLSTLESDVKAQEKARRAQQGGEGDKGRAAADALRRAMDETRAIVQGAALAAGGGGGGGGSN